jgi:aarF domain-containing kinase
MRISTYAVASILAAASSSSTPSALAFAFQTPFTTTVVSHSRRRSSSTKLHSTKERSSTRVSNLSQQMREMQAQIISENEDADLIIQALRGKNINDDDTQVQGLEMNLIDFDDVDVSQDNADRLPYEYDPVALKNFFSKRPNLITARIAQVMSKGGSVVINFARDVLTGAIKNDPDLEVKRAAELRDTITSLGPFFIKLGQALSIRPDILSPRSMVELQKLCDKVPSFDSKIAFETMERELGRPVDEVFSEITPEPVAAASLGQVYKATLRATGETVAVKVRVDMRGEHAMKIGCLEHLSLTSALSCTLFHS